MHQATSSSSSFLAVAAATYTSDTEYVKMTHRNVPAAAEEIQRAGWCWNEGYDMAMSPVLLPTTLGCMNMMFA